jgi:hypothetical protein
VRRNMGKGCALMRECSIVRFGIEQYAVTVTAQYSVMSGDLG